MMTSKAMSATNMAMTLGLNLSVFNTPQALSSSTHATRICRQSESTDTEIIGGKMGHSHVS